MDGGGHKQTGEEVGKGRRAVFTTCFLCVDFAVERQRFFVGLAVD